MNTIYRVEFNEKQQNFHLDRGTHEENTYGWFTIYEKATNDEFHIYEAYVNRIKKGKLTKDYLLQCRAELNGFLQNLSEYDLRIQ